MTTTTSNPLKTAAAAALAACAALALMLAGASRAADDKKSAPKPALTVTVAVPQQLSLPITLAANGNLAAWQEAIVGSETAGLRLTEVRANVGDAVRKGQVLAVFATDTLRAELAQARASLAEAQASAADAAGNAERARSLQATGALSASQINQYFTAEKTAQARVEAANALFQVFHSGLLPCYRVSDKLAYFTKTPRAYKTRDPQAENRH